MKKILLTLLCTFISFQVFAQEENTDAVNAQAQEQNKPAENTQVKCNCV